MFGLTFTQETLWLEFASSLGASDLMSSERCVIVVNKLLKLGDVLLKPRSRTEPNLEVFHLYFEFVFFLVWSLDDLNLSRDCEVRQFVGHQE